jgi:glutamate synthase domain-containing protein 2
MPNINQIKSRNFPKIRKKSKKYQKNPNFFLNFPQSSKALNGPHQYQKIQRILNKSQKIPKKFQKNTKHPQHPQKMIQIPNIMKPLKNGSKSEY